MQNTPSWLAYLIPLALISGFLLFPLLIWLGKKDERHNPKK